MPSLIKICGLSEETTLLAAIDAGTDLVGFVHFPQSPRHVTLEHAAELKSLLPAHVASVLVVVDPNDALLDQISTKLAPTYIQLHGKESPERVAAIRTRYPKQKLIKALPVESKADLAAATLYEPYADMLMFDAKPSKDALLPGGNGISFDWKILQGFMSKKPWILSGGLNSANVAEAMMQSGASGVDVSSGVETAPGKKDIKLIQEFVLKARG